MGLVKKAAIYFHTLRYLRPVQVYGRVWFKLYQPWPRLDAAPPLRRRSGGWVSPVTKCPSMVSTTGFRFLNEAHELSFPRDWNSPEREKLWLYNLHYFDDLNAKGAGARETWHRDLIARWIDENPPGYGNGWEPYPISLRIVNWIKWALGGASLEPVWVDSLAVQARFLARRLEWHLLGNHLFANVKALAFAGAFFSGDEANGWLSKGLRVLDRELDEQVLADGGHFERSPMYHAIIYEDVLDLINLFTAFPDVLPKAWRTLLEKLERTAQKMGQWLAAMTHPDGEIALFNDAAFGIAAPPAELQQYAARLGLGDVAACITGVTRLAETGYVRAEWSDAVLFADVGDIGPDYLPGHAHADTLGFELSVFGQRVFVDSGTSCYGSSAERLCQRSTRAHNTVEVDGQDSSEVWGGFRVARRAKPHSLRIEVNPGHILIAGSHNGYMRLPGHVSHGRTWYVKEKSLLIEDCLDGEFGYAVARYHIHPDVRVEVGADGMAGVFCLPGGERLGWHLSGGRGKLIPSSYHPEFGVTVANTCLEVEFDGGVATLSVAWNDNAYSFSDR